MSVIEVDHLTKDYGHHRGVFDVTFNVEKGEVYGFLGPNGAGKTTVIRHIMGFSRPQKGQTRVNGLDSWNHSSDIQKNLGYLPGEIALPESLTGKQFLKMMMDLRELKDMSHTNYLLKKFELNPSGRLKRMSLGEKRKLAIVIAFMHNPDVLVLDEPTSGLDPIMQDIFIDFIKEEKKKGKTILLSSHMFTEVDATCDRISIIKEGQLVSTFSVHELRNSFDKTFKIEFCSSKDYLQFEKNIPHVKNIVVVSFRPKQNQVILSVKKQHMNELVHILSNYRMKFFSERIMTLEDYFMKFYDRDATNEGGSR